MKSNIAFGIWIFTLLSMGIYLDIMPTLKKLEDGHYVNDSQSSQSSSTQSSQSNSNCTTSGAHSFAYKRMSINGNVMDIKLVESGYRQWEATGIVYTRLGQTYNYLLIRCFDGSFVIKDIQVRKL